MEKFYVDTNVFLRFLLNDVPAQYQESREYLARAKSGKIELILCTAIVFEIHFALTKFYKFEKTKVIDGLATIINMPYLTVEDRGVFQEALLLYLKNNLDLVDCFILAKANKEGAKVLSFDEDLKKLTISSK